MLGTYQTSRSSWPSIRSATAALSARRIWSLVSAWSAPKSSSPSAGSVTIAPALPSKQSPCG